MLRTQPALVATCSLLSLAIVSAEARAEDNVKSIINKTRHATALIVTNGASGTGWVIDRANRLVVTNQHVVEHNSTVLVFFPIYKDNKPVTERTAYRDELGLRGEVVDADVARDLAVIQLKDRLPDEVGELKLAGESAESGDVLHSIGNPGASGGALWVYTSGRVRAVFDKEWQDLDMERKSVLWRKAKVVLADSPVNPGDSGGPVVNDKGEVVGVVSHGKTMDRGRQIQAMNAHIDVTEVKAFVDQTRTLMKPKTATDYIERAKRRLEQRRTDAAIEDLSEALKLEKKNATAYERRGWAFFRKGDYDTAIADCNEAIRLNDDDAKAYYTRGWAFERKKEIEKSLADYTRAIQLDTKLANAYNNRGVLYENHKNDLTRALADYTRAIELDPRNDVALSNRADVYWGARNHQKAFDDADHALDVNPFSVPAWDIRGWVLRDKNPEASVKNFTQALEFVPNAPILYLNRGISYSKVEKGLGKAYEDYTKAIELDRDYHWAYFYRGQVFEQVGSFKDTQADFKKALELYPKHGDKVKNFTSRYMKVANETNEPIRVYMQYEYKTKDNNWIWWPEDPTKGSWLIKPGEASVLIDGEFKIRARRVKVWAVGEKSGGSNTTYRTTPLQIAPEDGYLATSEMIYTHKFTSGK